MPALFKSVLVPYNGSEPSIAALDWASRLARQGSALIILNAVDQTPVIAQSNTTVTAFDPKPLLDALDQEGRLLCEDARKRVGEAGLSAEYEISHEPPVPAILDAASKHDCDLIVMGTHARQGLSRLFIGSTTEGVLRSSEVPVLTVREETRAPSKEPVARALVGVDESDPADAALQLATRIAQTFGTRLVLCNVVDTRDLYDEARQFGYDPQALRDEKLAHARKIVDSGAAHAKCSDYDVVIVEGEPADALVRASADQKAGLIVIGSHGRRGLQRLFLGSVAEHVVRASDVAVLVVRR